jgi:hypothetical protein
VSVKNIPIVSTINLTVTAIVYFHRMDKLQAYQNSLTLVRQEFALSFWSISWLTAIQYRRIMEIRAPVSEREEGS